VCLCGLCCLVCVCWGVGVLRVWWGVVVVGLCCGVWGLVCVWFCWWGVCDVVGFCVCFSFVLFGGVVVLVFWCSGLGWWLCVVGVEVWVVVVWFVLFVLLSCYVCLCFGFLLV
jgi:hypothetical protein